MNTSREQKAKPKTAPVRSQAYLRAVASLACYRCRLEGYTQACHGDLDKGMATKTSDLTAWPGCGPHHDEEGCHEFVGRRMSREERRTFEKEAAEATIRRLIEMSHEDWKLRKTLQAVGLVK